MVARGWLRVRWSVDCFVLDGLGGGRCDCAMQWRERERERDMLLITRVVCVFFFCALIDDVCGVFSLSTVG